VGLAAPLRRPDILWLLRRRLRGCWWLAGLLTRSFLHTQQQRIGFDTDRNTLVLLVR